MELFPHFVGFCVLVVLLSLLSSAQKQQLSKSRDWIFPRQMMPSSSPQLPALAQDAFQRLHCPNLLSADVAVTPLHSRARTGTPCRARMEKFHFQPKGESTEHVASLHTHWRYSSVFTHCCLGRSRVKTLCICCPPQCVSGSSASEK